MNDVPMPPGWSSPSNPISEAFDRVRESLGLDSVNLDRKASREALFDALYPIEATACNQCGMCCKSFCLPLDGWVLLEAKKAYVEGKDWELWEFKRTVFDENGEEKEEVGYFNPKGFHETLTKWLMEHVTPITREERKEIEHELQMREGNVDRDLFKCDLLDESGDLPRCTIHDSEDYPSTCAKYQPHSQGGYLVQLEVPHVRCSYNDHDWEREDFIHRYKSRFLYSNKTMEAFLKEVQDKEIERFKGPSKI